MQTTIKHPWNLSEDDVLKLQQELAAKVVKENKVGETHLVAGVDVAYAKKSDKLVAAVVVLDANSLEIIDTVTAEDIVQ